MQTANVILALSGERDNTVPKYGITPAELLLLQALHGGDAVTEIDVQEAPLDTTSRAERERLHLFYARAVPGRPRTCPELEALFPGAAARLPETFDELEIDEALYARETVRKVPSPAPQTAADPLDHDGNGRKGGSKKGGTRKPKTAAAKIETPPADAEDAGEDDAQEDDNLFN